jgi:hypothetical protein
VFVALQPTDSIEAFWAKDIVDLTLEIERLRQIEAGFLEARARDADHEQDVMDRHLAHVRANFALYDWAQERGLDHRSDTPEMKTQWARFHEGELSQLSQNATSRDIPTDPSDFARSFLRHATELDRIGRMIATAEARRRAVLRELEQYRAVRRARSSRSGIIDAAFMEPAAPQ